MSKPRRRHDASRLAFGKTVRHSASRGASCRRLGSPALRRIRSFSLPLNSPISSGSACTDGCRRGGHFQLQRSERGKENKKVNIKKGWGLRGEDLGNSFGSKMGHGKNRTV